MRLGGTTRRSPLVNRLLMRVHSVVTLLESSEASTTVVLRAAAALLVAEVLAGVGGEQAFSTVQHVSRLSKRKFIPQDFSQLTDVLSILTAPLHLGLVIRLREELFLTGHLWDGSVGGVVELGSVVSVLQHDRAVAELLHKTILALNGGIGDLGNLVALEAVPPLVATRVDKVNDVQGINKVDKGVANVAVICEVDSQVHEVVLTPARFINDALQHGLVHLVWDVSEHDGGADVGAFSNLVDIDVVVVRAWWTEGGSVDTRRILSTIVGPLEGIAAKKFVRALEAHVRSGAWEGGA